MKKALLLFLTTCFHFSYAQIVEENEYQKPHIKRVNLDTYGEKYISNDFLLGYDFEINVFNDDHTLWKTIDLPSYNDGLIVSYIPISQKLFNDDDLLEFAYVLESMDPTSERTLYVIDENNNVLFQRANVSNIQLSQLKGFDYKLSVFYESSSVLSHDYYDPKTMQVTHSFHNRSCSRMERNGQEAFFALSDNQLTIDFYDAAGTYFKTVPLPISTVNQSYVYPLFVADSLNSDSLVEMLINMPTQTTKNRYVILNEDETILFDEELDQIDMSFNENKAFRLVGYKDGETYVYSKNTFALEHVFPSIVSRIHVDGYGEKYLFNNLNNSTIELYNSDFTSWKTIPINHPNLRLINSYLFTSNKIDLDNELEFIVSVHDSTLNDSELMLMDESGTIIHSFIDQDQVSLSEINGLVNELISYENKLLQPSFSIFKITNAPLSNEEVDYTNEFELSAFPNPFKNRITLELETETPITSIEIFNSVGTKISVNYISTATDRYQLDFNHLPDGVYFVNINDSKERKSMKIIKQN